MLGTPDYMSPEQARGQAEVDIRSDVYSLGATLYHLVTGRTPFEGTSAAVVMTKHLTEQVPWPQDVDPEVSVHCCRLIQKMMAKDPVDRYEAPAELIPDIERVIKGDSPAVAELDARKSSIGASGSIKVEPRSFRPRRRRRREGRAARSGNWDQTRSPDPVRRKRPLPAPLLAAAAAVLLLAGLIIGLLFVDDGRADTREKDLGEMFDYALDEWAAHRDDRSGNIRRFEMVRAAAAGTDWAERACAAIKEIKGPDSGGGP
jgi:hypothetical protein